MAAACRASGCLMWGDCCDVLQAERLEEKRRQEEQRRRVKLQQDHLRSALDQVNLGPITVTLWYCVGWSVLCCVLSCLQLILVIDVALDDNISCPLQKKHPVSDPLLTYNCHLSLSRHLAFSVVRKEKNRIWVRILGEARDTGTPRSSFDYPHLYSNLLVVGIPDFLGLHNW